MSDVRQSFGIRCDYFLSMASGEAQVQRDQYIGITDAKITEIRPFDETCRGKAARFIDAGGKLAMPGMVNGHTHLPMTLFRGLQDDVPFHRWLFERILPLEAKLVDADFVRTGAELGLLESIRFGVTTVNEMYHYAETSAEAIDRLGLRAIVAQPFVSGPTPEDRDLGTDKGALFNRLRESYAGHARITAALGPHAPYSVTDEDWRKVVALSNQHHAPIHTHLCETAFEVSESKKLHGVGPVERLHRLGALGPRTLCAHCIHLDPSDIQLMHSSGASVIYNPDSNMKLSSGIAPVTQYLRQNIPLALGTDGAASNNDLSLFGAMDIGTKLQKLATGDNTAMVATDALRAATWGGAKALGLGDRIGSLETGKEADLVLIDLRFPHMQPIHDIRSQLVYAAQGLEVDTVMCAGKLLLEGKQFVGIDTGELYLRVEKQRAKIQSTISSMA